MKTTLGTLIILMVSMEMYAQYPMDYLGEVSTYGDNYTASANAKGMVAGMMNSMDYLQAGMNYEKMDNYQAALSELDKAIALDENLAEAYDYKSIVYIKLGRFQKALREANLALRYRNDMPEALNHRGIAYYYLMNYTQAINDYTRALTLKPDYGTAYYNRAIARLTLEDYEGAYDDLIRARQLKCEDANSVLKEFFPEE